MCASNTLCCYSISPTVLTPHATPLPETTRDPVKILVTDFSQALANLHDKFGHELQTLVETFRKRNGELRKER